MAKYVSVLPEMTSNTTPIPFVAFCSSTDSYEPFYAFDKNRRPDLGWWPKTKNANEHIGIDLGQGNEKIIVKYTLRCQNTPQFSFKLQGSKDKVTWVDLDTKNSFNFTHDFTHEFYINNTNSYRYFRMLKTSSGDWSPQVSELDLFELQFEKKILFQLGNGETHILSRLVYNTNNSIPIMTSDTIPSGVAFASSVLNNDITTYGAFRAFNSITTDQWISKVYAVTNEWLGYQFPTPKIIGKYFVQSGSGTNGVKHKPKSWRFEGSNDGSNYEVLHTVADSGFNNTTPDQNITCTIDNPKPFTYYRLYILSCTGTDYITITEMKMFEVALPALKVLPSLTESVFMNHGANKADSIELSRAITTRVYVDNSSSPLGNGKVFKKTIDTSKLKVKGMSIN